MIIEKVKTDFDVIVERYIELKNEESTLKEQVEATKKDIVSRMNGQEKVVTDYHTVTNKEQIRDGIDLNKLKALYPEAYNACFKPSIYPVLRTK